METETEDTIMLQIGDTLVSLDLAERFFCCDLDACHGECCIEGDAGAPITENEKKELERLLPEINDELLPQAQEVIRRQGVSLSLIHISEPTRHLRISFAVFWL